MMKKFCLVLIVIMLHIGAYKAQASKWSDFGNYEISWFNKNKTVFELSTAKQLSGLAYIVNNKYSDFKGKTIKLTADIDLLGNYWVPIGINGTFFCGTFDGNNHQITNIQINNEWSVSLGFWTILNSGAMISNLSLKGWVQSSHNAGLLAGEAYSTVFNNVRIESNMYFENTNSVSTEWTPEFSIGGVIGTASYCELYNVSSKYNVSLKFGASSGMSCYGRVELATGGVVGKGENNNYDRCKTESNGDITVNGYTTNSWYTSHGSSLVYFGGIVGIEQGSYTQISSCYSKLLSYTGLHRCGTFDRVFFCTGGIAGKVNIYDKSVVVKNCIAITEAYSTSSKTIPYLYSSQGGTSSNFGGVVGVQPKNVLLCYSNNDVNDNKVKFNNEGANGSSSFSRRQMMTSAFLDEINFCTQMEYGKALWCLKNGEIALLPLEDVNGDGKTNSADVSTIYNYVIDEDTIFEEKERSWGDVNHDGIVNSADVVTVYNYIVDGR